MPVDERYDVAQERNKAGSEFRYKCNSHPKRKPGYWAPDRVYLDDNSFVSTLMFIETEWIDYDSCPAYHNHTGCTDCSWVPEALEAVL
mgnify:FL=1